MAEPCVSSRSTAPEPKLPHVVLHSLPGARWTAFREVLNLMELEAEAVLGGHTATRTEGTQGIVAA